jgi:hypothetical protein
MNIIGGFQNIIINKRLDYFFFIIGDTSICKIYIVKFVIFLVSLYYSVSVAQLPWYQHLVLRKPLYFCEFDYIGNVL